MGWQDAPVVGEEPQRAAWESAPVVGEEAPAPKAPVWSTPPKGNSTLDYLINSAKKGVGDFASLPGLIVDAFRGLTKSQFMEEMEKRGLVKPEGEIVKGGWAGLSRSGWDQLLGADRDMKAPGTASRLAGKAVEFAVAGGPFSARTIAQAPNVGRALIAEAGSAIGGGVGSELGGDIGEKMGSRTAGEVVGGVVGGISGLATPTVIDRAASYVAPRLSAAGREQAVQRIADRRLRGALDANPSTQANLRHAEQTTDDINRLALSGESGGRTMRPTIGQATGAPGVIDIERGVASGSPEDLGRYAARQGENRAAVDVATGAVFPPGGQVTRGAANTLTRATRALDDRLEAVMRQQEAVAANVRNAPQQIVGQQLQNLRDQAQNIARQAKNARVSDLYATAERLGVRDTMDDVVAVVRGLGQSDEHIYQNMPPVFGKVLREHGKDTKALTGRAIDPDLMAEAGIGVSKPVTFKEIHSLWREANSQLAAAQRTGDNNAAYYLSVLKDSLGQKLAKFEEQGFGELSEKFKDFNRWFSTKYAPAFYEGVGGRMNARGRFGDIVKPEDVTAKFFTPSGIDDFNMIVTQLPAEAQATANATLRDGIVGMFREKVVKDGIIDRTAARNFLRSNQETLDKVPDIRAALQDPTRTADALAERAARLSAGQRDLDKSRLAQIAKSDDPDGLIQRALGSQRELMALVSSARDESSRRAVLRAIADGIPQAAERAGMDPLAFLMANQQMIRPVLNRLGPEHFENLRIIAGAETILGRTVQPQHANVQRIIDPIEQATGSSPRTIWSQSVNTTAGRQSGMSAVLHLLSRYGIKMGEERVTDVMREVIYNPELARTLSQAASRPVTNAATNRLRGHLANAGIRVGATTEAE